MSETATRPSTARGQATRERIVTAAAQLMFERGVAGTSTPDVRDAAAVSSSQIYHYFADKSALTRAVIEFQAARILDGQQALLGRLDSMRALRAWRDAVVSIVRDLDCRGGCPLGSLTNELADSDPLARAALADSFTRWTTAIEDGLRAMVDRGVLRDDTDPHHLALATVAALQGGLILTRAHRDTEALEAGLDAMLERIAFHAAP
ncbi:TetR/AcrR family transcriptional regulator [Nocardia sp. NPDC051570]|uniref:TetR/AcrR family transcriptional regulator n=1 Tax=Nocardia sp. NPDC051570 TaxID=3364324 RepID=UPI0037ADDF56